MFSCRGRGRARRSPDQLLYADTQNKQVEKECGNKSFTTTFSSGNISQCSKLASPLFNPKHLQEKVVSEEELQIVDKGDCKNIQIKENVSNIQTEVDSVLLGSNCSESGNDNHFTSEDTLVNCTAQKSIDNLLQNDLTVVCSIQPKEVIFKPASNKEDNITEVTVNPECHGAPIKSKNELVSGSEKKNNVDMTDTKNGVDMLQQKRNSVDITSDVKHIVDKSQKQNSNDMTSKLKHLVDISQKQNGNMMPDIKHGVHTLQIQNSNDMTSDIKHGVDTLQIQNSNDTTSDIKHGVDSLQIQNSNDMTSDIKHGVDPTKKEKKSKKKKNKKVGELEEIKTKCRTKKGKEKEKEKKNGKVKRIPKELSSPESVYQHKNSIDQEEELTSPQQIKKEKIISTTLVQENFNENEKNFTAEGSDDDNWELLFDDDGECCNPEMLEEVAVFKFLHACCCVYITVWVDIK